MRLSELHWLPTWVPDWLVAVAVVLLTTVVAYVAFSLLRVLLHATLKSEQKLTHAILQRVGSVAQLAFVLLILALVAPALPLDPAATGILHRILVAAFIVMMGWAGGLACDLAIERYIGHFRLDVEDNLLARKAVTQIRVLKRTAEVTIGVVTAGFALMTFDTVREFGISLFASAGVAGLAVGLAARPLLSNLIAGVQLAITQPIRIDDVVVVEGEWGWIEEFTATYVVIRIWDWRRLIVPLSYFLENPVQNWTRVSSSIIGSAVFYVDYTADVDRIRTKFHELLKESKRWDSNVASLQVTNVTERTIEVRTLMSARNSSLVWDLRCEIREKLLTFLQKECPEYLPRWRADVTELPAR